MYEFHLDRKRYFDIQVSNAAQYVIPFIERKFSIRDGMRVLEIGCGEGGVLKAFIDRGCTGVGVEFDHTRIVNGSTWLEKEIKEHKIEFVTKDIYETSKEELGSFDIIVLKDVIEHIHDQSRLIGQLKLFLNPGGVIFFGFPPWQMPYGGHQQLCHHALTSKLPYYHLLPRPIYKAILKLYKEPVNELLEIRDEGISIERFEKIVHKKEYLILDKEHYLINPIYKWKFNLEAKKQFSFITKLPFVRNFFTTCVYYLIKEL